MGKDKFRPFIAVLEQPATCEPNCPTMQKNTRRREG
jgi:hypothetical protein